MIEITDTLLIKLAGEPAYRRGLAYFEEERVSVIESDGRKTTAVVNGTYPYRVEIIHTARQLDGACECPASEGIDFCKHCVATALVLRERQDADRGDLSKTRSDRIRAYLLSLDSEALVDELLDLLPRVPDLEDRLLLRAETASGAVSVRQLRKMLTAVTRPRNLWEYREVAAWFGRLEKVLENIVAIADDVPPEVLLNATLYGIERVDRALEKIDDSGGYRFGAQAMLRELHVAALRRIDWPPDRKASHLLELALLSPWDQFADVPGAYIDALGEDGLDEFYTQVETKLAAMPAHGRNDEDEFGSLRYRLAQYLRERAEANEDWDALLALEISLARTAVDFARVAALYLRKRDTDSAVEWIRKVESHAGAGVADVLPLWVAVHGLREDWAAATEAQETLFKKDPSIENYMELLEFADLAGSADRVRHRARDWLATPAEPWFLDQRRACVLAEICMAEGDWQGVYESTNGRIRDPGTTLKIARSLAEPRPELASEIYRQAIDGLIGKKNNGGYRAAARALRESRACFAAVGASEFSKYVEELRQRHRRKRNLLAELDGIE